MISGLKEKLTGLKSDLKAPLAATNQRKRNEWAIHRFKKSLSQSTVLCKCIQEQRKKWRGTKQVWTQMLYFWINEHEFFIN